MAPARTAKRQRELDERIAARLEPVKFVPIKKDPFKPQTRITMVQDVGGKFENPIYRYSLAAGKSYWVDEDIADNFIIKGYASGKLSREYSDDERAQIRSSVQTVTMKREVLQDG